MESLLVSKYMSLHPVRLTEKMSVAEAVEMLLYHNQSGGPVLDSNGVLCGFLSEQDCIKAMVESTYYREQICRVGEIMQSPVLTVTPGMSILEVAEKLLREKPKVYPVVDADNKLVGAITRTQILDAIDKHLRAEYPKSA
ncbi:CBS domain-containing protein [Alteromonas gilva]|uniref:CBS domain-containing protein n=1 Tax=Alteromonas gilva TaxID=2987522 RepID=A0ABT5L2M9_9ALTE|nr:CBS domain-containing protein [Alteromonas gilva]MDC8831300.1 CBS domain-containing protein [Alteromonas gilva]